MGLFGQPGESLGKKRWDNLTDQERKRLFYRDRAREEKQRAKAERKHMKAVRKAEKMDRQQREWKRKAEWLAARNRLEREKEARRKRTFLYRLARKI